MGAVGQGMGHVPAALARGQRVGDQRAAKKNRCARVPQAFRRAHSIHSLHAGLRWRTIVGAGRQAFAMRGSPPEPPTRSLSMDARLARLNP